MGRPKRDITSLKKPVQTIACTGHASFLKPIATSIEFLKPSLYPNVDNVDNVGDELVPRLKERVGLTPFLWAIPSMLKEDIDVSFSVRKVSAWRLGREALTHQTTE